MLRKVVAATQRGWVYVLDGHQQEGVDAIVKQRASARPNPKVLLGMLKLNIEQMGTPATKGMPFGVQSEQDWDQALKVMEKAKLVKAGWKTSDYFTNEFVPAKP
jgi:NitT/TauT family transport system substrate-binding protein